MSKLSRDSARSIEVLKASAYQCSPIRLGPFHIIGIGSTDTCLIHISGIWPIRPWTPDELRQVPAPPNCKKIIHHWGKRKHLPDVQEM